jgi:hypothetical protein
MILRSIMAFTLKIRVKWGREQGARGKGQKNEPANAYV